MTLDENAAPEAQFHGPLTVAAVIITRNRIPLLRETLKSLSNATYPISQVIVSDDSSNDETAEMLATEFPHVIRVVGPRRGISANRNRGMSLAFSDYILLSDDDMAIDPLFVQRGIEEAVRSRADLVFGGVDENGKLIFPNTLNFLGYSNEPYKPGMPFNTANQQCFLVSKSLVTRLPYDEIIEAYGYEEMDFGYRVAASGATIRCIPVCAALHLAPQSDQPVRPERDACRLYVTYKRAAYIDKRPLKAFAFLLVAIPHHLISSTLRYGRKGIPQAFSNFRHAFRMLRRYRHSVSS